MIRARSLRILARHLLTLILVISINVTLPLSHASNLPPSAKRIQIAGSKYTNQSTPDATQSADTPASSSKLNDSQLIAGHKLSTTYGAFPLSFEVNQGQSDPQVKFLSHNAGSSIFLTSTEAVIVISKEKSRGSHSKKQRKNRGFKNRLAKKATVIRTGLVGANDRPHITGLDQLQSKTNYFTGTNSNDWKTGISSYSKVKYEAVYPGIDLVYYGNQRQLEYDFLVSPGADPRIIKFKFEGTQKIRLAANGDLILDAGGTRVCQTKPVAYQEVGGIKQTVACHYALIDKKVVGFQLGDYDPTRPLVIDPVLRYSTYYGGSENDWGNGIAVDAGGNVYVTGTTVSTNFPTHAALQPAFAGFGDAFVIKLDATGSTVIYATYLGGERSG